MNPISLYRLILIKKIFAQLDTCDAKLINQLYVYSQQFSSKASGTDSISADEKRLDRAGYLDINGWAWQEKSDFKLWGKIQRRIAILSSPKRQINQTGLLQEIDNALNAVLISRPLRQLKMEQGQDCIAAFVSILEKFFLRLESRLAQKYPNMDLSRDLVLLHGQFSAKSRCDVVDDDLVDRLYVTSAELKSKQEHCFREILEHFGRLFAVGHGQKRQKRILLNKIGKYIQLFYGHQSLEHGKVIDQLLVVLEKIDNRVAIVEQGHSNVEKTKIIEKSEKKIALSNIQNLVEFVTGQINLALRGQNKQRFHYYMSLYRNIVHAMRKSPDWPIWRSWIEELAVKS